MIARLVLAFIFFLFFLVFACNLEDKEETTPAPRVSSPVDTLKVPRGCSLDSNGLPLCPDLRPPAPPK